METLKKYDRIELHGLRYKVVAFADLWFLEAEGMINSTIFKKLGIENKFQFCKDIIGYMPKEGGFPEVETLEDLTKIAEALINYGKSKHEEMEVYTNF